MLRHLRISNLAVIEAVEVEFEPGFNVLTGETGAGKSILVEAVGLLVGGRASSDLVRTGESQATIEALFELTDPMPDLGREIVIRREIGREGRSRAYVNGALATATMLRDLAARLVEIHGQHEHQALLDPTSHLSVLDAFASLEDAASTVAERWQEVRRVRARLADCRMDEREKLARLELLSFQVGEIEAVSPKANEDATLAIERQVLASADQLQRLCQESYDALYDGEGAALATLSGVWKRVGELASLDPRFQPYAETREAITGQLEDLALFLRDYLSGVDVSPAALQQTEDRLAAIERLKRKFGPTLDDVQARWQAFSEERARLGGDGEQQADLEAELASASKRFLDEADRLSEQRRAAGVNLAEQLEGALDGLAMARTRFEVRFNPDRVPEDRWGPHGVDEVEFFVSPNVGESVRPLSRVVSGGELSRIMLALKTMAATRGSAETLVFDEVDAGIGGSVAGTVGERLGDLGRQFQVLCITHLPAIAARATTQFQIEKVVRGDRTTTSVRRLDGAARVAELGRMIGGETPSEQVLGSAREMLAIATPELSAPSKQRTSRESERRKRKAKHRGAEVPD